MVKPYTYFPLTQSKKTLIDCEDLDKFLGHSWQAAHDKRSGIWYAQRGSGPAAHRTVMGCHKRDGAHVDHINGDGLDNRKKNLRVGGSRENQENRRHSQSKYGAGVTRRGNRYIARGVVEGRNTYMGMYDTPEEAQRARAEWLAAYKSGNRPPLRGKNRDAKGRFAHKA